MLLAVVGADWQKILLKVGGQEVTVERQVAQTVEALQEKVSEVKADTELPKDVQEKVVDVLQDATAEVIHAWAASDLRAIKAADLPLNATLRLLQMGEGLNIMIAAKYGQLNQLRLEVETPNGKALRMREEWKRTGNFIFRWPQDFGVSDPEVLEDGEYIARLGFSGRGLERPIVLDEQRFRMKDGKGYVPVHAVDDGRGGAHRSPPN